MLPPNLLHFGYPLAAAFGQVKVERLLRVPPVCVLEPWRYGQVAAQANEFDPEPGLFDWNEREHALERFG
jgi:hypothetical protein